MPGGLINIAAYGAQDLYLTGTPEITFFKIVYRRHTNFSMESVEVNFDDTFGFGKESNLIIPSVGDLIHKIYLKVKLPYVSLGGRKIDNYIQKRKVELCKNNLIIIQKYMILNTQAYRKALEQYKVDNVTTATDMIDVILQVFNITGVVGINNVIIGKSEKLMIINNFYNLIAQKIYSKKKYSLEDIDLRLIAENSKGTIYEQDKNEFLILINNAIYNSQVIYNEFNKMYVDSISEYKEASNTYYKFAWVKKLGHSMIEYIDVYIGGERIDRHYGEWLDIWFELTGNKNMQKTYNNLIGNTEDLTTFDRRIKYSNTLMIPLQFWFCKYNGLALPIVAMQYSDVSIKLKLRKINECCYIDEELKGVAIQDLLNGESYVTDVNVNDQLQFSYGLKGSLYVDFIYLDGPERRKFAQVSHEYLIDQVETQSEIHTENIISTTLNFNYCSKEIIWILQKQSYIENNDQHTECMWWNYGVNKNGSVNPVLSAKIEFSGYSIITEQTGNYFNYLQPYTKHKNTPSDGINVYSFSLRPEEHQPTGTGNFTRISQARLYMTINPKVYKLGGCEEEENDEKKKKKDDEEEEKENNEEEKKDEEKDTLTLKIFSLRVNVLRIAGGYGALGFV